MALRILSGIIVPREDHQTSGEVVLKFNPYELDHESYDIAQLVYVGERSNGDFKHAPWHVISLREFSFLDNDHAQSGEALNADRKKFHVRAARLKEGERPTQRMRIAWNATICRPPGSSAINEIAYMIIGEV